MIFVMPENKKYFYFKLKENFFYSPKILRLQGMPRGDTYTIILEKLYLATLNNAGKLEFEEGLPMSANDISRMFHRSVKTIENALEIFEKIGLLTTLDDGTKQLTGIEDLVGESSKEADRKRSYRNRKKNELEEKKGQSFKKINGTKVGQCPGQMSHIVRDRVIVKDRDRKKESNKERNDKQEISNFNHQKIVDSFNQTCTSLSKIEFLTDRQKRALDKCLQEFSIEKIILAFQKVQSSKFLCGNGGKKWRATFDWILNEFNLANILNGKYDDFSNFQADKAKTNDKQINVQMSEEDKKRAKFCNMLKVFDNGDPDWSLLDEAERVSV